MTLNSLTKWIGLDGFVLCIFSREEMGGFVSILIKGAAVSNGE